MSVSGLSMVALAAIQLQTVTTESAADTAITDETAEQSIIVSYRNQVVADNTDFQYYHGKDVLTQNLEIKAWVEVISGVGTDWAVGTLLYYSSSAQPIGQTTRSFAGLVLYNAPGDDVRNQFRLFAGDSGFYGRGPDGNDHEIPWARCQLNFDVRLI